MFNSFVSAQLLHSLRGLQRTPVVHDYRESRWGHSIQKIAVEADTGRVKFGGHGAVDAGDIVVLRDESRWKLRIPE